MKTKIAFFLAIVVVLLLAIIPSCGGEAGNDGEKSIESGEPEVGTEADDGLYVAHYLPETGFEGHRFRAVTTPKDYPWRTEFDIGEESGEVFDDALYKRNRIVEERYDIILEEIVLDGGWPGLYGNLRKSVSSDSDDFDLHMMICRDAFKASMEGFVTPVSDLKYVDISQPWYAQNINRDMSVGGKLFFAYSDECINMLELSVITLFNKNILADLAMEDVYALVDGGKWTIDKFFEMAKEANQKIDAGGAAGDDKRYGVVSPYDWFFASFWVGADIKTVMKDENNVPYFNGHNNQKLDDLLQKVYNHVYGGEDAYLDTVALMPSDPIGRARKVFEENGALFWIGGVCDIQTLRAMENNFGIAPLPKFDEAQKEYRTRTIDGWVNVVPSNARNTERTSIVMEALAVESKNYTIPAYYEVALKAKHIRDEDSERMLDLIYETRTMDMGDVVWMDNIRNVYVGEFNSKKNNFTSAVEKQLPTIEKTISKAIEAFANLP